MEFWVIFGEFLKGRLFVLCDFSIGVTLKISCSELRASSVANAQIEEEQVGVKVEEQVEAEVAKGYTITQFCDKIIDLFLNEKPKTKEWRKYLVFREEWKKYRDSFYKRCQSRAKAENDSQMKQKLIGLLGKVKKVKLTFIPGILLCIFVPRRNNNN